jgi:acyl-CoA thioester hydrolase
VRNYELDRNGHVNNAVYINWAEQVTHEHAEAAGFGREWAIGKGGAWVIRGHQISYLRPVFDGDEIEITVRVEMVQGVRGVRRTTMRRPPDGEPVAEVLTEWVWVRLSDGRPARVPPELVALVAGANPAPALARPRRISTSRSTRAAPSP